MRRFLNATFHRLDRAVEIFLAVVLAAMVIVGGLQVFMRYVMNNSLPWSEEFQKFAHIWRVFFAIPVGYRRGAHIGMEVLRNKLPAAARRVLTVLTDILWLLLGGAIVFFTALFQSGIYQNLLSVARFQKSPGMQLRMDLVYLCMVIGGLYLMLVAARKLASPWLTPEPPAGEGA